MFATVREELVSHADKTELWPELQTYLGELAHYSHDLKPVDGIFAYDWFDDYWIEADRWPFWAVVDGERAGFALVRREEDGAMEMSEFYIRQAFRCTGIGLCFARLLLARFPGAWIISEFADNTTAIAFWRRVVENYAYTERPYMEGGDARLEQRVTVTS